MKKTLWLVLLVSALFFGLGRSSETRTKPEQAQREQEKNRSTIIALKSGEPSALAYDGGTMRFLVSGGDTGGAWSLVELTEPPGTKTTWHRHNHSDQAYYVMEGVFTVKVGDKTYELPSGSYIFIPRGIHRPWPHFTDEARKEQTSETRRLRRSMTNISA